MANLQAYIASVESVTLRDVRQAHTVHGEDQAEVVIRTTAGEVVIGLIVKRGKTLRVVDLRQRDRAKRRKGRKGSEPLMPVGFEGR